MNNTSESARDTLKRLETRANKALGQNFLVDTQILQDIESLIQEHVQPTFVEVGPGLGALTEILAATGKRVVAIEKDQLLAEELKRALSEKGIQNVEVHIGDARTFDFSTIEGPYTFVSNLPFNAGTFILRSAVEHAHPPESSIVIMQKEVVERIAVNDGKWSLLSLAIQLETTATRVRTISKRAYHPKPAVDTALLLLEKRDTPLISLEGEEKADFFRLLKWAFAGKRKQLSNTLASGLHVPTARAKEVLQQASIEPSIRAERLQLSDWERLFRTLQKEQLI
ncbi:MAG: ribosomal RNA small subunit methyltransferase A [Candidatus Doudnabacteria bacterium]|nr:ribosomal RNA small subunit methyltransferase A [Candidatus Doudnabacteria bacterium]MCA9387985.1 ribosomal RNA small subunit methyltransferase A [Candidatus Andersenbacteria bacterium]